MIKVNNKKCRTKPVSSISEKRVVISTKFLIKDKRFVAKDASSVPVLSQHFWHQRMLHSHVEINCEIVLFLIFPVLHRCVQSRHHWTSRISFLRFISQSNILQGTEDRHIYCPSSQEESRGVKTSEENFTGDFLSCEWIWSQFLKKINYLAPNVWLHSPVDSSAQLVS